MLSLILSLLATVVAGGVFKQLFLSRYSFAGVYFNAIASTALLIMAVSVVTAVFRARPVLAPAFALLSSSLVTAFFYAREAASFLSLVLSGLGLVAFVTWMLAFIGCMLRRRLQHMD